MRRKRVIYETVQEAIQAIADANDGRVTPEQVVDAARDEESPLHGHIEWDDGNAAFAHRLDQARMLIRSVKLVITTQTLKVKSVAFVRDPEKDPRDAGYVSVTKIKTDEDLKRDVLIQEFSRAAASIKRARVLATVFDMEEDVDQFLVSIDAFRQQLEAPAVQN